MLKTLRNPEDGTQVLVDDEKENGPEYPGWELVCEGLPMEDLQADTWRSVKAIRDIKQTSVCSTPYGLVQCDEKSMLRISMLLELAKSKEPTWTTDFRTADNEDVPVNAEQLAEIAAAVGQYILDCHEHSLQLKNEIDTATSDKKIKDVKIEEGWPS